MNLIKGLDRSRRTQLKNRGQWDRDPSEPTPHRDSSKDPRTFRSTLPCAQWIMLGQKYVSPFDSGFPYIPEPVAVCHIGPGDRRRGHESK